ncbi:hypothetical protein ACQEU5_04480 [Marinactinospora thermotolerans]|uniref:Uncharacterized protein n=1 Tax=Marinactinospora thermotolerans DSM 45154 TaxID=1122192 RepID=A0A1T4QEA0_9ACTN|nr:hypothetical protein [Marinactinospora thermotolerans]SKA02143.1 hypothetical protein SAMN02745673_02189 [Marinactinospora thermotolerans DSM 45154]
MIPRKSRYRDELRELDARQRVTLAAGSAARAAAVYDYFADDSERAVLASAVEELWSLDPGGPEQARAVLERLGAIWPYGDDPDPEFEADEPEYEPDEPRYWKIRALEVPRFAFLELAEEDSLRAADRAIQFGIGLVQEVEGAIGADPLRGLAEEYADSRGPFEELEGDLLEESLRIVREEPEAEARRRLRERSAAHGRRVREVLLPVLASSSGWSPDDIEAARG